MPNNCRTYGLRRLQSALKPWCPACDDTGERVGRDAETDERGTFYHDWRVEECADCPRCPCGMRLAEHEIFDVKVGDVRPVRPADLLYVGSECWVGECYEAHLDAQDEPEPVESALRGIGYGLALSVPVWALAVALWVLS